jgi:soluble lytic murein transglycosylase-like protein
MIRALLFLLLLVPALARAGAQVEEQLAASVQAALSKAVADQAPNSAGFANEGEGRVWIAIMSSRLAAKIPDAKTRLDFLHSVHYESVRAGLDPQLVLGLIEVESGFRKYAVSVAGARGFMQVMPFWLKQIGSAEQNLFHLRTNLRYGCTILRYYVDLEKGDLFRALGRYNGSLGRSEYPNAVLAAWKKHWSMPGDDAVKLAAQ